MNFGEWTEQEVFEVFAVDYRFKTGTFYGVHNAFEWWKNPSQKCAIVQAGRGGNRCNRICEFCASTMNGAKK